MELNQKVQDILNNLPCLSLQRKIELATAARLGDWTRDADVHIALQGFNVFMLVMSRLVSLIAQLVKDSTVHVVAADAVRGPKSFKLEQLMGANTW